MLLFFTGLILIRFRLPEPSRVLGGLVPSADIPSCLNAWPFLSPILLNFLGRRLAVRTRECLVRLGERRKVRCARRAHDVRMRRLDELEVARLYCRAARRRVEPQNLQPS